MENKFVKQVIPFTQVPNGLLYNPDISFKAKGLWAYMSAKPEGWNFSADRIAMETKEERKAILAGLKELSENGYITAKKLKDGRIEYTLHWNNSAEHKQLDKIDTVSDTVSDTVEDAKQEPKKVYAVDIDAKKKRPRRSDYATDDEYEKAFYKWNTMV